MNWNIELAYFVTPKSGPMRPMKTLRDVNHALLDDLPARCRHQRHWFAVGRLLLTAAAKGSNRLDLRLATDALVMALEVEGWMTWQSLIKRTDDQKPSLPTTLSEKVDKVHLPLALAA